MTKTDKRRIEREARTAAQAGQDKADCPYPFHSEEALLWVAVWALSRDVT